MRTFHFETVARKHRSHDLVPTIRHLSKAFKRHEAQGDRANMRATSTKAWGKLVELFDVLRNEQDQGRLDPQLMRAMTGNIVQRISRAEQAQLIGANRISPYHPNFRPLNLRGVLSKIAHFDTVSATYRIDGRGAHYLVLGGPEQSHADQFWVAEILVSRLCNNAAAAIKALA